MFITPQQKAFLISIGLLLLMLLITWLFLGALNSFTVGYLLTSIILLLIAFGLTYMWVNSEFFSNQVRHVKRNDAKNYKNVITYTIVCIVVSSFFILSIHTGDKKEFATALMCALSSMSIGTVVGFLFGVPKTLQNRNNGQEDENEKQNNPSKKSLFSKRPNTNLEEVSDWLTKIIVGVSLIEFQNITSALDKAAVSIAKSMGANPGEHEPYIMALLIFYLMFGFLVGYLLTRVYLANLFSKADVEIETMNLQNLFSKVDGKIENLNDELQIIEKRISEHSEVESLVAQGDYYRRKAKEEPDERHKWLSMAEATLDMAISIDKKNIPAHIVKSKCLSNRGEQLKGVEELEKLENKLEDAKVSPKTNARINYNKACMYFLYAKDEGKENRKRNVDKSFKLLSMAMKESAYKTIVKFDTDWDEMREDETARFNEITGQ